MNLKRENKILKQKIEELETRFMNLESAYRLELDTLKKAFETKIKTLEAELATYKHKKNSSNSHIPPSQDQFRAKKNQSLREPTSKKVGGQVGHEGNTLQRKEFPDKIVKHSPKTCVCCSASLATCTEELVSTRQVFDIPPIVVKCTEHQTYKKKCSCGYITEASFPLHVAAPVQYGENVESMIAYLHTRQYLPYQRMQELLNTVMGLAISTGGINNILKRFAKKATPLYDIIKEKIKAATVVGVDETGININGKTNWGWTWQNSTLTYIVFAVSRGFKTVLEVFPNGLLNVVLVQDRWACHFKTPAKAHQMCTAHLLRDINYINELYENKCEWATEFKALLLEAINLKKELKIIDYYHHNIKRQAVFEKMQLCLTRPIASEHIKAVKLQKTMLARKDCILNFLLYFNVPPDNNGSERAIRNIKVKQKVSGQFKNLEAANIFAVIRSIIDTTIKNGQNVFSALRLIANYGTE